MVFQLRYVAFVELFAMSLFALQGFITGAAAAAAAAAADASSELCCTQLELQLPASANGSLQSVCTAGCHRPRYATTPVVALHL